MRCAVTNRSSQRVLQDELEKALLIIARVKVAIACGGASSLIVKRIDSIVSPTAASRPGDNPTLFDDRDGIA